MFKKVIAGIASVTLALGMVALTATPASAHTPSVDATCTSLHVKLTQYSDGDTNHVTVTLDGASPAAADVADFGQTYEQTFAFTPGAATHSYTVVIDVTDPVANHNQTQYDKTFTGTVKNCLPDDTDKKIDLCHRNGNGGYSSNNLDVNSIINHSGHGGHSGDIIPPFTYTLQGVPGSYPGQNWTPINIIYWNHGCHAADVTPAAATFTDAVCTGVGTVGTGSYTIPTTTGVEYLVSINDGTWTLKAAGTYNVPVGTKVEVDANATAGYQISGNDDWSDTITGPTASKCVVPAAPTFTAQICTGPGTTSQASYTIPSSTGIQYQKWNGSAWVNINAGVYNVNSFTTQVKIKAIKTGTYIIVNGSVVDWTYDFLSAGACTQTFYPPAPSFTDATCTAPGVPSSSSYTVFAGTGVASYQVSTNGGPFLAFPGTLGVPQVVPQGTTIVIKAIAAYGYTPTSYTFGSHLFPVKDCIEVLYPPAPSFTDATCTAPGVPSPSTYTVYAGTGVASYEISTNGGPFLPFGGSLGVAQTVPQDTTIVVKAIAAFGYSPTSYTFNSHHFPVKDCIENFEPTTPSYVDAVCTEVPGDSTDATYTLNDAVGLLKYQVSVNDGAFADFGGTLGTPVVVPQGTKIQVKAIALFGYAPSEVVFDAFTFAVKDCLVDIDKKVEGDPTFYEGCVEGSYVEPYFNVIAADHVNYTYSVNAVEQGAIVPGSHTANAGDVIVITAHPDAGYELNENPWVWTHNFANPTATCVITPPALTCLVLDDEETKGPPSLTLPFVAHVKWIVDGAPAASGPISVPLSILDTHITAVSETGYSFPDGSTTSWTFGLDENGECGIPTLADQPTNVTHTDQVCNAGSKTGGTVTVGLVDGVSFFDEVNYYLDGSDTPMTTATAAVAPGVHTVTASAKDPDDGIDGLDAWEFTVLAAPASCDLTTLALTGAGSNPIGWAGIGYYLLVTGLALIAVRTVRRRNEVKQ